MINKIKITAMLGLTGILVACSNQSETKPESELNVVTSFYPMYDFTKNVTGEDVNISILTASGVEPHDYEPSAKDMAKIQDADVFVYNSDEMETWVPAVLESIDTSNVTVIEASKGIELMSSTEEDEHEDETSEEHEGHSHGADPHVWLDPVLAQKEVETIRDGLIEAKPENKEVYTKNAESYNKKLNELNDAFINATKNAKNKKFVTQHTAFSYLAREYGLTQIAISGISPDEEPTPKELTRIEDMVKEEQIKTIYTESSASSKVAQTIVSATGVRLLELNPLESLTQKEMEDGDDYITVMYRNLDNLKVSIK